jgi:hypothetical protein
MPLSCVAQTRGVCVVSIDVSCKEAPEMLDTCGIPSVDADVGVIAVFQ